VDSSRNRVAAGAIGQIMISGATVTPGYLVTDGSAAPEQPMDGWLMTGDLGRIDEDGYLTIVGREKEVINRGGEKVFPYEIEKAILGHPAVLEAAVFGVPHPRLGESVAAAVVLKPERGIGPRSRSSSPTVWRPTSSPHGGYRHSPATRQHGKGLAQCLGSSPLPTGNGCGGPPARTGAS
jgi:acyl-CoA synthetase (AMP-forming)/AMP-acid ligase II